MKRLAICIALQAALLALCQVSYAQKIIYVNDNSTANDYFTTATGNDANAGSAASPFATLAKAMDAAASGDRILLDAGTYLAPSITVKSGVKIIGTAGDNTVITVQNGPLSLQGNTELWNLKIQRIIPGTAGGPPTISVSLAAGANDVVIENCYFIRNRTAIYLEPGSTNITIKRNRFNDNRTGIIFPGSANPTSLSKIYIIDNELTDNRSYGFILTDNANSPVEAYLLGNNITGNLAGGLEIDNTHSGTKIVLRNNWFGSANPTIFAGNTNGGFNVADHDNPAPPILVNNNSLPGVSYPNQISGTNTGAIDNGTLIYANGAQPRPGTVNFIASNNTSITGHSTFSYFPSIADAISASNTDAVITLPDGVYSDNVFVTKKVTLTGVHRANAIIRGTYDIGIQNNGDAVIKVTAADAKIQKLTVTRDYGTSLAVWQKGNRDAGISINAANVTIDEVTVKDQRSGIYAHTQQGFKITNSLIEKNRTGISLGSDISNSTITNNVIRDNFTHGIIFNHGFGTGIIANDVKVRYNAFSGNWYTDIYAHGTGATSVYATADLSCNTYNTNAANTVTSGASETPYTSQTPGQFGGSSPGFVATFAGDKIANVTTAPWLINVPAPGSGALNFVPSNGSLNVDAITGSFSPANNNYRILANAIGCVQENQTITLNGNFDWSETNAVTEWAKGTNGKAGDGVGTVTGTGDDYSITPPLAVNGVTITATAGSATIQGGGDLAATSLETFLFLNGRAGSSYKNWTISNLIIKGFDVSILGDINGGPADVSDNLKITNNEIHIPVDLNATAAPADNFQNLGIHYAHGKNIEISSNKFFIDGTGVSDNASQKYSTSNAIQSATSGGPVYDGLKIINNEFTVTGAPNAAAAVIHGIWENGDNEGAEIEVSGNKFTNDTPGNTADKNRQTAIWVTSRSGASKNVTFKNNEISGYAEGIAWLGGIYTVYEPPVYNAGANPVLILNNSFNATGNGIIVRKNGTSTNTGSPAKINYNSFTGSLTNDIVNEGSGATEASCNWFDGGEVLSSIGGGSIVATPKLTNGTDDQPGTTGFQTTAPCEFNVKNTRTGETFATIQGAVDDSDTQDGDEIAIANGTYNERVTLTKAVQLFGQSKAGVILDGTGLAGTGSGIVINTGKTGVIIQDLTIKNYTGASGNSHAGIYAIGGNNNLTVQRVVSSNNSTASGFYANGPIDNVLIDDLTVENNGGGARGIVIWNGLKTHITIKNSTVKNNTCCGIELQDGSASGVLIKNNVIEGNDSSIGLIGLTGGSGANIIEDNTISVKGRFGIEIKNPNGTGSTDVSADGSIIVRNNTVTFAGLPPGGEVRDLAGISVYRRGVIEANGNVDIPTGVVVTNNTVSGFVQPSLSEGFGIVVEGTNHKVLNNNLSGNDVDVQRQAGNLPYVAYSTTDGDQNNKEDLLFGRGNAPYSCGIEVSGNTGNAVRDVTYDAVAGFVINTNTGATFCSISAAVASTKTLDTHVIKVGPGTFNEQVVVNKSVTIQSATPTRPVINFTGTPAGKPSVFDVSADKVVIDNLNFKVDLTRLRSAIIASSATLNEIAITNNLIEGDGVPLPDKYGDRNAVSVNYGGPTSYRIAGGLNKITFTGNTVKGVGTNQFRAGIAADEASGTFNNNNLQAISHDVIVRFASNGGVTINNNTFNGGGVEIPELNGSATGLTISGNTFTGDFANASGTATLRLKNNTNNKPITVSNNTFEGYEWGISLENVQGVTLDNNMLTPKSGSTTFRHVTVNTKELSSSSGFYPPVLGGTFTNNKFNGSGAAGGTGLAFYNQDNDSPVFGTFQVGTSGNENEFAGTLANFIFMDGQSGTTAAPVTSIAPWSGNIDASNNKFDVGSGPEPASGMTLESLYKVEDKIVHKIDNGTLGFALVKSGNTYVTPLSFATPVTTEPKIQRGVDAADNGWNVNVKAGTYAEDLIVNKAVKLYGANQGINPNTGSRASETIVVPGTNNTDEGMIISVSGALTGAEIDGFTIDGDNAAISGGVSMSGADVNAAEGIAATGGVTNLLVKNNIIKNLNYAGVDIYNENGNATTGNVISDNKFNNLLPNVFGIGVLLYNNGYANVTNNVMTAVRIGVQTGNFEKADPGNSHAIESNTIEAKRKGIWHNLTYSNAANFSIKNNTITALAGTVLNDGIMISSTQGSVAPVVENNTITGLPGVSNGYHLWNNPSNTVKVKGGTVSGVVNGVFANNFDGYPDNTGSDAEPSAYTVDGLTINSAVNGVFVKDNPSNTNNAKVQLTLTGGSLIDQPSENGVKVEGRDAQLVVGSTEIKMAGSAFNAIFTTSGQWSTTGSNVIIKPGLNIELSAISNHALFCDGRAIVELDGDFTIPTGGADTPFAFNGGQLVFTSGKIDATSKPVLFVNTEGDITTGTKPETATSYILGKATWYGDVNTSAVSFLGVNLPAGSNLGTLTIDRITSNGPITPAFAAGAIKVVWNITPGNPGVGRNGVKFSFLSNFLNTQNTSALYGYRHNGTSWEKKTPVISASLSGDLYTTSAFDVTQFSPWTLSSASDALPVTLISFNGVKEENTALLTWATSEETNSDRFDIQHSTDGKTWAVVGSQVSGGESVVKRNYSFRHDEPVDGQNFYRLKMIDRATDGNDGTFAYSRIVTLQFGSNAVTTLYPNPVSDHMKITTTNWNQVKQVRIYDMLGRTIYDSGSKPTALVSLHNVPAGMYVVEISRLNGKVENSKIMVNR